MFLPLSVFFWLPSLLFLTCFTHFISLSLASLLAGLGLGLGLSRNLSCDWVKKRRRHVSSCTGSIISLFYISFRDGLLYSTFSVHDISFGQPSRGVLFLAFLCLPRMCLAPLHSPLYPQPLLCLWLFIVTVSFVISLCSVPFSYSGSSETRSTQSLKMVLSRLPYRAVKGLILSCSSVWFCSYPGLTRKMLVTMFSMMSNKSSLIFSRSCRFLSNVSPSGYSRSKAKNCIMSIYLVLSVEVTDPLAFFSLFLSQNAAPKAMTPEEKFQIITGHLQEFTKGEILKEVRLSSIAHLAVLASMRL